MNKEKIIKGLKWFFHSYIWVGVILLVIDIVTKNIVVNVMSGEGDSYEFIPGFLSFSYVVNRHAAFGIGPEDPTASRVLYICVATIATIGISIWFAKGYKKMPGYVRAALMIIVAGALGNMIDRIFYTAEYLKVIPGMSPGVVDFLDFFKGSALHDAWHYIFNIADCGVVVGTFMLLAWMIIDEVKAYKERKKHEAEEGIVEDKTRVLSESEKRKLEEQEQNRVE